MQKRLVEEEEKEEERKERKRRKEREKKLRRKERLKDIPKSSDKAKLPVLPREEEGFLNLDEEMNTSVSCEEESATETGDVDEDLSPPDDDQDGWKRVIYNKGRQQVITHYCVREVIIDDEAGKGWFTTKEGKKMEEVGVRQKKDPMMSRTSSSDNYSSCLSEGDSNGSHSMSDSEGRENLVFTENYMPVDQAADERRDMESPGPQTDSDQDLFSLFHFGGPVALSTRGSKSGDYVFGDLTGNCKKKKKESIVGEEYNLFAKSNSLRFSIF